MYIWFDKFLWNEKRNSLGKPILCKNDHCHPRNVKLMLFLLVTRSRTLPEWKKLVKKISPYFALNLKKMITIVFVMNISLCQQRQIDPLICRIASEDWGSTAIDRTVSLQSKCPARTAASCCLSERSAATPWDHRSGSTFRCNPIAGGCSRTPPVPRIRHLPGWRTPASTIALWRESAVQSRTHRWPTRGREQSLEDLLRNHSGEAKKEIQDIRRNRY